jgi:hypothetical protein
MANFSKIGRNVGADIARRCLKATVFSTMLNIIPLPRPMDFVR